MCLLLKTHPLFIHNLATLSLREFIQGEDLCATLGVIFLWLAVPFSTMVGMVAMSKLGMVAMSKKGAEKEAGIQHLTR